jgi:hypothetical protein
MSSVISIGVLASADPNISFIQLQKMAFIYRALEAGWAIRKNEDSYIFTKKHEGKKEVYLDSYLQQFIETNLT